MAQGDVEMIFKKIEAVIISAPVSFFKGVIIFMHLKENKVVGDVIPFGTCLMCTFKEGDKIACSI